MIDYEHGIALQAMKRYQVSSHGEGEVPWFFSSWVGNLGYILVTVGMILQSSCLFSDVRTPV